MWKKTLLKIIIAATALFIGYILFVSSFHFSEGMRIGYLSKFAKKGYVFKTYEGDIFIGGATAGNSTLVNNLWSFSVKSSDTEVIEQMQKYQGTIVRAHYYQVLKNMPWQGDTEYFVIKVEFVRHE